MLTICPEIQNCIPKQLTADEKSQLEKNIVNDGCREPLSVWTRYREPRESFPDELVEECVLLDGHNRLEICERRGIEYTTHEIHDINSISEAKIWAFENQFGRRNLNKFGSAELALALKEELAVQAKERQREHGGTAPGKKSLIQKSGEVSEGTDKKLAKLAGLSHDTIYKAGIIKQAVDDGAIVPEVEQELRAGTTSINKVYQGKAKPWKDEKKRKVERAKQSPDERIAEIRRLAEQGCLAERIAIKIGLAPSTVRHYASKAGIDLHGRVAGHQKIDPDRVVGETVLAAKSLSAGEDLLKRVLPDVDQSRIDECLEMLGEAQSFLRRLTRLLKETKGGQ